MKELKNLVLSFSDEGGNKKNITFTSPSASVKRDRAQAVADTITSRDLVLGKVGHLKTYNGAYIVTRTEDVL